MRLLQRAALTLDGFLQILESLEARRTRWFFRLFPIRDWLSGCDTLLDIGCGSFDITNELSTQNTRLVVGIDIEDLRRRKYGVRSSSAFVIANGGSLPFRSNSFRGITLFWILHHSDDPRSVLREAVRVVKAGGTIIVVEDVPLSDSWWAKKTLRIYDRVINLEFSHHPHNNLPVESWRAIFRGIEHVEECDQTLYPVLPHLQSLAFLAVRLRKIDDNSPIQ